VAELEGADPALANEDLWSVAEILAFQQVKEKVEARAVDQGITVEVETQISEGRCRRLLNYGLCPLRMRTDPCVYPVEVPW